MTRGPVGRRGAGALDLGRKLDTGTILAALLVIGLVLRVFIAGIYLPLSGFAIDIGDFTAWGQRLASVGPAGFYAADYFSDYPPGYLYVLWLLGAIGGALTPLAGQDATGGLVKIPGILADVGVAWLLFVICRRWGGELLARAAGARIGPSAETLGLAAATIYLFNPGTIFNSAVWGQIDSVGTLAVLGTVYLLARGWTEAAAVGAVVALLVKFQFGFIVPVVLAVGLKRHLFGRSADPARDGRQEPARVLTSVAAGVGALVLLLLPFEMTLYAPLAGGDPRGLLGLLPSADPSTSLVGKFVEAAGTYNGLTINAFNLWRNPWSGLGDSLHWGCDAPSLDPASACSAAGSGIAMVIGSTIVTWQAVSTVLFAAAAALALWQVARRDHLRGVLIATLVLAVAFYVLPTRVHERYLFPALALAAPLVLRHWSWWAIYGALSLSFFANVYWVYSEDWSFAGDRVINPGALGEPMPQDPVFAATFGTDAGIWLLSAMIVVVLGIIAWRSLRLGLRPVAAPGPSAAAATADEPTPPPRRAPDATDWATDHDAYPPSAQPPVPARRPSRFAWLRSDPRDPYLKEPTRRLDRVDVAILLGLVLFALVFRLWRLDVPRAMHFDEVYHARSATEWLADWQHGWQRDVYEWTHPMLAKYLIAGGIVLADPNQVVGRTELDRPASALAVAPERSSAGRDASIAFTADGQGRITARDVDSGEAVAQWEAGGPVATLAFDEAGMRLLVGRADIGEIEAFDLVAFLSTQGERAPPPRMAPIETGLAAVSQIVVPPPSEARLESDPDLLLVRGPGGLASLDRVTGEALAELELATAAIGHLGATGELPERVVATVPEANSVRFLDAATLQPTGKEATDVAVDTALIGPLVTRGSGDDQQVFALAGPLPASDEHPATGGGLAVIAGNPLALVDVAPLPGAATAIGWQRVANLVYVAGTSPEGEPVVWTVEPHGEGDRRMVGFAPFDTTALPGQALALGFDVSAHGQADDHGRLLVSTATAEGAALVTVDAGSNAFAWRLAGVLFGAALVGLIYLLAATMFSRRRIAVLAAAFVAVDGMSYTMSRISMNDIFVAFFVVAAYLVFWQVWSGRWRRSAWWALPVVGVLIGLAAATKWVGFYALAGLLVLVLARSPLGRLILVGALAFVVVVAGLGAPWPFLLVMLAGLAVALIVVYRRPIHIDWAEARLALPATGAVIGGIGLAFLLAYPTVEGREPGGSVELLFGILARGAQAGWPVWIMLGVGAVLIVARAVASLREPASDARWFGPGELSGFAWAWAGACLVVVPLTVYGLSYLPYLQLGHSFAISDTGPGYGWSLDELHSQMFGYHFGLQAGHDSASPWWSWPLALKPTWFFNGTYDGNQIAVIYNGGNPILFWAGIPAMVACAALAWKRRSLALCLLVVAFAFQYLPWTRIERATFSYHYLTAVVFTMIAVAYAVDELLRRPAWRDLAVGYLALAVLAGLLIFPLGAALPMPDWYINAARALPPWSFAFQFPDPPQGERGDLLSVSGAKLLLAGAVSVAALIFAVVGRDWWRRRNDRGRGEAAKPAEG